MCEATAWWVGKWPSGHSKGKNAPHTITPAAAPGQQAVTICNLISQSIGVQVVFEYCICLSLGLQLAVLPLEHPQITSPRSSETGAHSNPKGQFKPT